MRDNVDAPVGFEVTGPPRFPNYGYPNVSCRATTVKRSSEFERGKAYFAEVFGRCTGLVCAVIGPCQAETVEAAHFRAFAKHGVHELRDGISHQNRRSNKMISNSLLSQRTDSGAVRVCAALNRTKPRPDV